MKFSERFDNKDLMKIPERVEEIGGSKSEVEGDPPKSDVIGKL